MEYEHRQTAFVIIVPITILCMIAVAILPAYNALQHPTLTVVIAFLVAMALFYDLKVKISHNTILCSFGIGLIQRRIPISEIAEAKTVQNPWYAGWGIRWLPGQYWMWNVSGLQAVELIFKDGRRFRIGTDEPEKLASAIQMNLSLTSQAGN
ncbi:MAG: hypothetical protein ACOY90_20200 [Candidatus Zhuqueibacterota bacterium]